MSPRRFLPMPTMPKTSSAPLLASSSGELADQLADGASEALKFADQNVLARIFRIADHAPALLSLSYFGLISMASMMNAGPMAVVDSAAAAEATLSSVLVKVVGPTTNSAFAAAFPTFVTPAASVFLVWPLIAALQLIAVTSSALRSALDPDGEEEEILDRDDLTSLTIANLFSSAWLVASSNASVGNLPVASCLLLPFVPLFAGRPSRMRTRARRGTRKRKVPWAFQVYAGFTTLASILAFTVEIQYGGRVPIIGNVGSELGGAVFLSLYSLASLAAPEKTLAKKLVNFGALTGILARRVAASVAAAGTGWFGGGLFLSISFWGTVGCWAWSLRELLFRK